MKLSELQKYTLKQAWQADKKIISKNILEKFYSNSKIKKPNDLIGVITKSVERLIKKDLLIGYGWRTSHKWFIQRVKLTSAGGKIARKLFGIQQKFPFKK